MSNASSSIWMNLISDSFKTHKQALALLDTPFFHTIDSATKVETKEVYKEIGSFIMYSYHLLQCSSNDLTS
jgi:hypothetical protein